jgi:hypothetical protein
MALVEACELGLEGIVSKHAGQPIFERKQQGNG